MGHSKLPIARLFDGKKNANMSSQAVKPVVTVNA
jgi:hypothetical protein